jgi:hypothetical protein
MERSIGPQMSSLRLTVTSASVEIVLFTVEHDHPAMLTQPVWYVGPGGQTRKQSAVEQQYGRTVSTIVGSQVG